MRAQVSNEFMILLGVATIFLLGFLYVLSDNMKLMVTDKEMTVIDDVGTSVQNEIFFAANAKDGYYREFEIPKHHQSVRYNITIQNKRLVIIAEQTQMVQGYMIPDVVGNVNLGQNIIRKEGGVIYVN